MAEELGKLKDSFEKNKDANENLENQYKDKFWTIKQKFDKENSPLLKAMTGVKASKDVFFDRVLKENGKNKSQLETRQVLEDAAKKCFESSLETIESIKAPDYQEILRLEKNKILEKSIIGKENIDIADLIKTLNNSDWVRAGTKYINYSKGYCPFCQQKLPSDFASKLNIYFDETYENDKKTVNDLLTSYKASTDLYLSDVSSILNLDVAQIKKDDIQKVFTNLKEKISDNIALIQSKLDNGS